MLPLVFSERTRVLYAKRFWHRVSGEGLLQPTRLKTIALGGLKLTGPVPGTHTLLPSWDLPTSGALGFSAHDPINKSLAGSPMLFDVKCANVTLKDCDIQVSFFSLQRNLSWLMSFGY